MTPTMLLVVFCGVLFWARAPFCCCCGHFCVRRYANLAGGFAFRPSAGCWFLCFCFDVATVVFELYSCGLVKLVQTFADLIRLSCFKDRASELYRPHSESKKEADITVSLVRILQFLYDSACGNAGTLMVSASLTLYACQLMGPWEYRKVPSFYGQTYGHCHCHQTHHCHHLHHHLRPQAHLPVVGCSLMGVSYHLSFRPLPGLSLPFGALSSLGSSPGGSPPPPSPPPPVSDAARLVGGRVGEHRLVISELGSIASNNGTAPSCPIVSHKS